jgi:hypothetical protein
VKPDEAALLKAVAAMPGGACVRDVIPDDMPDRRAVYLLRKWAGKGWYDYGVSVDLGWLTEKGREAARDA